jgi:hypothetical protein
MSNKQTKPNQPFPLRRCYFCGSNVQVKWDDPFLLRVHENGRSFNFCINHLQAFLKIAPFSLIDFYRRTYLKEEQKKILIKQVPLEVMTKSLFQQHPYWKA